MSLQFDIYGKSTGLWTEKALLSTAVNCIEGSLIKANLLQWQSRRIGMSALPAAPWFREHILAVVTFTSSFFQLLFISSLTLHLLSLPHIHRKNTSTVFLFCPLSLLSSLCSSYFLLVSHYLSLIFPPGQFVCSCEMRVVIEERPGAEWKSWCVSSRQVT